MESLGRAVLGWVDSGIKGGVLVACVYLYDGGGWSERNMIIMQAVAKVIVSLDQPFVLMDDFNMSHNEFSQGSFLELIKGVVQAPDEPTFQTATTNSVIVFL